YRKTQHNASTVISKMPDLGAGKKSSYSFWVHLLWLIVFGLLWKASFNRGPFFMVQPFVYHENSTKRACSYRVYENRKLFNDEKKQHNC
ncbi:MAG: hypothetical protein BRD50_05950, partial [Bacteroidetes bacterium SW_11_45_7]